MKNDIVFVNSDPKICEGAKNHLRDNEYNLITLTNPEETLDVIFKKRPCMVVQEFGMPGRNNLTLLQGIKSLMPETPIVLIMGKNDLGNVNRTVFGNGCMLMGKPINWPHLKETFHLFSSAANNAVKI